MSLPFQRDFPAVEFTTRRARVCDLIGPSAFALIQGAGPCERSEPFRQTNEFYYLCGVEAPQALLLLDGGRRRTTLFLPPRDVRQERSEGPGIAQEDETEICRLTGVDAVQSPDQLGRFLGDAHVLYTPHSPGEGPAAYRDELIHAARRIEADPWDSRRGREELLIDLLRKQHPEIEFRDLSPLLDSLRIIKSAREVEMMRRAGRITALAVREAMRSTRPGLREYHLGAVADYVFKVNGARGAAYRAIIASGANIWYAHYWRNDRELKDGDLVLMDFAPDYHYYTSDIGRTWPVRGRFTDEQWEQYRFVNSFHQELLKRIRPGVLPSLILSEAAAEMEKIIDRTRFMNAAFEAAARRALTFNGHLSHPVGMAVHDVGRYVDRPLEPGVAFAVDPQLWAPEEKLYVRVEDTVVVTGDGMENLTALAPLELDDIEIEIARPSILAAHPPVYVDEDHSE